MTQKEIAEDIRTAVQTLRQGGLILYPTDTIWGIGCDAANEEAVRRIFQLKQRQDAAIPSAGARCGLGPRGVCR